MMRVHLSVWTILALGSSACGGVATLSDNEPVSEEANEDLMLGDGAGGASRAKQAEKPSPAASEPMDAEGEVDDISVIVGLVKNKDKARSDGDSRSSAEEPARTRAWFPETFLWEPVIETGPDGVAEVPVRVPDRLTTWRVLGLAHSQEGSQAGLVHTFDTVQDVYVDPVLPGHLHVGDRLELPVQAVNTSSQVQQATLDVRGAASLRGGTTTDVRLQANGSVLRTVSLQAPYAGQGMIEAELSGLDKVVRQVPVRPVGKPHLDVAGGSLTDVRAFSLPGPDGADPATQELVVDVYPGGLAVLQSELDRLGAGGSVADPSYGFAVTSVLDELAAAAGAELDEDAVRRVRQQSWQRLVRSAGLDPQPDALIPLLGALRQVEDHELAQERRDLWALRLVEFQRADGTWAPGSSGSVQSLLVQTATAAWVLPDDEAYDTARLRASGAIERLARQVDDPYTAAVVVASGLVEGDLRDELEQTVLDGVRERSDGSRTVSVPRVYSAMAGGSPSRAEALAWTRLALDRRDDLPWRDDLVAELMSGYGARGFGAGRADQVALVAVADALPPITAPVSVALLLDDEEVARGTLDPAQPRTPLALAAAPGAQDPRYTLKVEGKAPGLAWTARLRSWTPWQAPRGNTGVEASFDPGRLQAGRLGTGRLVVSAPGGSQVTAHIGLPAGTWIDVDALRRHPAVRSAEQREDTLELGLRPLTPAEILEVPITLQPAFAGDFSTGPLSLEIRGSGSRDLDLPPPRWRVGL